jgi:outer membrane protein assembly factor BamB
VFPVLILVALNNPYLFSSKTLWVDELHGEKSLPAFSPTHRILSQEVTSMYRGDLKRSGYTAQDAGLDFKKAWQAIQLNNNPHSASKSSPAVDQDIVVIGSDLGSIYAMNHRGQVIWQLTTTYNSRGIHATAAMDKSFVYIGAYNGRFYCLDRLTGQLQWVSQLGDTIGSSALLYNGAIYVGVEKFNPANGFLEKLDAGDGHMVWRTDYFGEQVHSSPAVDEASQLLLVGANSSKLYAIDSNSGKIVWSKALRGMIKSTPAIGDRHVYVTDRAGYLSSFELPSGNLQWETLLSGSLAPLEGSQSSPALLLEENLLVAAARDGTISGVDLSEGKILWQIKNPHTPLHTSALITRTHYKNNKFLAWIECEKNFLCALNPRSGEILKKIDVEGPISSVPVFYEGALFVSTDGDFENKKAGKLIKFTTEQH